MHGYIAKLITINIHTIHTVTYYKWTSNKASPWWVKLKNPSSHCFERKHFPGLPKQVPVLFNICFNTRKHWEQVYMLSQFCWHFNELMNQYQAWMCLLECSFLMVIPNMVMNLHNCLLLLRILWHFVSVVCSRLSRGKVLNKKLSLKNRCLFLFSAGLYRVASRCPWICNEGRRWLVKMRHVAPVAYLLGLCLLGGGVIESVTGQNEAAPPTAGKTEFSFFTNIAQRFVFFQGANIFNVSVRNHSKMKLPHFY